MRGVRQKEGERRGGGLALVGEGYEAGSVRNSRREEGRGARGAMERERPGRKHRQGEHGKQCNGGMTTRTTRTTGSKEEEERSSARLRGRGSQVPLLVSFSLPRMLFRARRIFRRIPFTDPGSSSTEMTCRFDKGAQREVEKGGGETGERRRKKNRSLTFRGTSAVLPAFLSSSATSIH